MMLQRRRARERLTDYARFIDIPGVPLEDRETWTPDENGRLGLEVDQVLDSDFLAVETDLADHHILILDGCQDLVEEKLLYYTDEDGTIWPYDQDAEMCGIQAQVCRRLMLMFPPGSAKSTYASVVFPTWQMGNNEGEEIILTGYGDVICKKHGKRARQICAGKAFRAVFDLNVDPNTKAADNWETGNKASYKSAGILSGITGFRCDGLIWDDITKGRKEADSQTIRDDTYNAYIDDARSRKKPKAWEVGIGTRWHEDETMGRILPEGYSGESGYMMGRDGNVWYVLCVPAECERTDDPLGREPGEMIWPEWFTEEYWEDKRVIPRSWASLYQQRPSLEEGLYFKKQWDRRWTELPKALNMYLSFDGAVTDEEDNANADDTVIQVWGVDDVARAFLVDSWIKKCTMDVWISQLLSWVQIYKPLEVCGESGVIRRACEPYLKREQRERGIFAMYNWAHRSADKAAMARGFQAMCSSGQVFLPATSVGDKMMDEMLRFPASGIDNQVDAAANFFMRLEEIWSAHPPTPPKQDATVLEHGIKIQSLMPARFPKKPSRWGQR
jgi:predicted phage terminase large subunit-like protein